MKRPRPESRRPTAMEAMASAKVNIGWRVGVKHLDGYHDVNGLLQTVSLHDRLMVAVHDDPDDVTGTTTVDVDAMPFGLSVDGAEATPDVGGPDDLVIRAARTLAETTGRARPTSLRLHKAIPVGAGLGGGSADAAACLVALTMAWRADLTTAEVVRIASLVGSDVPAVVVGGLVHVSGRGERVRSVGCASRMRFVLGVASDGLDTGTVYRTFDGLPPDEGSRLEHNDLQRAALTVRPDLSDGLRAMSEAGSPVVFVAGSGPTVVGVAPDPADAEGIAARAAPAFRRTLVCDPVPWGVRLVLRGRKRSADGA